MKYIRSIKKVLFNIIWIGLAACVLFLLIGVLLAKKHEDKITKIAIEQVNQKLESKISVEKVEISFFSKIPYVSVVFNNVTVWSPNSFNREAFDTNESEKLLVAEKIYLQFNLFQLLQKKYIINRILIINGEANLLVDKDGKTNYQIFKQNVEAENSENEMPHIKLQALRISNFNIKFISKTKNIFSEGELKDLTMKGEFSQQEFSLVNNISILLKTISYDNVSYAENYNLSGKTILNVKDKFATIIKGNFLVNDINLSTSGTIDFSSEPILKVQLEGRGLDINTLLNLIPQKLSEKYSLEVKGRADIATRIDGTFSSTQSPEIKAVFLLSLDKFSHKNISLSNIQLKGKLLLPGNKESGKSSLNIEKYRIDDTNIKLEGSFYLTDFSHPEMKLTTIGYSDLLFINDQLSGNSLKNLYGVVQPNIIIETSLKSFQELTIQSILNSRVSGTIGFVNTGFLLDENYRFENMNGTVSINKNSWLGDLDLVFNGSQTHIKAKADYFLNYLLEENRTLWLQADIQSELFETQVFSEGSGSSISDTEGYFLPKNIYAKLNVGLGELVHEKLVMKNLKALVDYKPGQIEIIDYSTNIMNGTVHGSAIIHQDATGTYLLGSKSNLKSIEIKNLFYSFDNFGQDVVKAEHINGKLSGDFKFSFSADSLLKINKSSINLNSQFVLNSGELIDFEPAKKLSGYIKLKELEHIQFSTLTNTILIREEIITIPEMEIKSSAFNIFVSGTHNFSNYFDYKLKINLSEILAGKARQSKLENEEHFVVEENGRRSSLYLSVKGTPDDYQFKYDKKEAALNIRQDLKTEKNTLKNILNEEFGWFKKDSITNKTLKEEKKAAFILDWDEQEDSIVLKKTKRERRNMPPEKETALKIEWDDDK